MSNTGNGATPGNITFHSHGLPFRDPGPNSSLSEYDKRPELFTPEDARKQTLKTYPHLQAMWDELTPAEQVALKQQIRDVFSASKSYDANISAVRGDSGRLSCSTGW